MKLLPLGFGVLSASMAHAQLLGFGATCPNIQMKITNVGYVDTKNVMAVAHAPDFTLINALEPLDNDVLDLIFADNGDLSDSEWDSRLSPAKFGVANNPRVCGREGEGYARSTMVDNDGDIDRGYSYPTINLEPVNTDACSCGDMRISILAGADTFQTTFMENHLVWLDGHELQSTTATTYAYALNYGISVENPSDSDPSYLTEVGIPHFAYDAPDQNQPPLYSSRAGLLVVFIPTSGSSSSFLSLWALLMHGWY